MAESPRRLAIRYTAIYMLFLYLPVSLILDYVAPVLASWIKGVRRPFSLEGSSFGETVSVDIFTVVFTYRAFRRLFDPAYQRTSSADRITYLTLLVPYDVAFRRCLDSLQVVGKPTILVENRTRGVIDAAVLPDPFWKISLIGFGDRIQFHLGSNLEEVTVVKIICRSSLSTIIFGPRHNERNVRRIAAFLQNAT